MTKSTKIMTGLQPYKDCGSQISTALAIVQNRLPAELSTISAPDFVLAILERCWQRPTEKRPTMLWCTEVLRHQTTSLFNTYCGGDFNKVPDEYRILNDQWCAVRNPDARSEVQVEFTAIGPW